ncbi:MAG: cyclic nucleotide-binding domain-containing protein [Dehalococcoidales bacterium]|nr:cyclic nucleotide-binding domain-containing protein [Dehalococcoidales bacterium]
MTIKQALRQCNVFSSLDDTALEQIASLAVEKQYEAGTTIFNEGDNADELLVLQEGEAVLQITVRDVVKQVNKRITVDITNRNSIVGWSAIVEPYSYTLTAVCLQKTRVLSIDGIKLRELLLDNKLVGYEILKELVKVVASRLNDTRQVLINERSLTTKSA